MRVTVHFKCCCNAAAAATSLLLLSACGSGGGTENTAAPSPPSTVQLQGSAGDGPIVSAEMRLRDKNGALIAESESDAFGRYTLTLQPVPDAYPLLMEATGGTDLVTGLPPDFMLRGVSLQRGNSLISNVNSYSTLAIEIARDLSGGITSGNVDTAQSIVVSALNNGLSTLATSGPLFTRIDENNMAELVRASEALAEIIRRTSSVLEGNGFNSDQDRVSAALGSDLTDRVIDGRGGSRNDARTAAIATLVKAQVVLEAMRNELRVNGVNATAAMTAAMEQVTPGQLRIGLGDLTVTADMLQQASVGLAAAEALGTSNAIRRLRGALGTVRTGMKPDQVRAAIPNDYRQTLDNFISVAAGANNATIAMVNELVRARSITPSVNSAPTIGGAPPSSVAAGSNYRFAPAAGDVDGDALSFSVSGKPGWLAFSNTTGVLSGTPSNGNAGTYNDIQISVSDGQATTGLPAFSITVVAGNSLPTIDGTPPGTASVDAAYSFTPNANDADGDTLAFAASGLPSWLNLNSATGRINGTPRAGDVGSYTGIRITVSDGTATATLGPFSITVQAINLGSVTLSWTPPTSNTDGSPLTNLVGYRIYWGPSVGNYPNSVTFNIAGLSSVVVENLAPGTYVFVATSRNSAGVESVFSNTATKTVQ